MAQSKKENGLIYKRFIKDKRRFNEYAKYRYKCKCGHSVSIPIFVDKTICSFCGNYVFKNKQDEFKFRIKEKLK